MAAQRAEIRAITVVRSVPTFENTILALETSGADMERVYAVYGVWHGGLSSPAFQEITQRLSPKLAAFSDEIMQNEALFQRIHSVYERRAELNLPPEQDRLLWLTHDNFVRSGANLSAEAKTRVAEINKELSGLFTQFSNNLL